MTSTRPIVINNTMHPIAIIRRRPVTGGTAAPLVDTERLQQLLAGLEPADAKLLRAMITPTAVRAPDGQPEFAVETVTLKPGANALEAEQYELVMEQRRKNPLVAARFERRIKPFGNIVTLNIGKCELEDATSLDRNTLQQAIQQCSDPATLRRFRDAFGDDRSMRELIEGQLAATTVTDGGEVTANDVKRDPRNPRRAAA